MNSYFKSLRYMFLITILSLTSVYAKDTQYKIRWKFNHFPVKYFTDTAEAFKARVEKETQGNVTVEIIIDHSKRDRNYYETNFENLKAGQFEISQIYTTVLAKKINYDFHVFSLPFLFEDDAHVTKVVDNKIGEKLLTSLDGSGVKGLAFTYSGGFEVIASKNKKKGQTVISKLEDFKGIKISKLDDHVLYKQLTFDTLGAVQVYNLKKDKFTRSFQDFKLGLTDFVVVTYADIIDFIKEYDDISINETRHSVLLTSIVVNEKFYNSLPKKYQLAVSKAARSAGLMERQAIIKDSQNIKKKLQRRGITKIIPFRKSELDRWKRKMTPVYEYFYSKTKNGRNLVREIKGLRKQNMTIGYSN